MTDRHWGGPVGAVLGKLAARRTTRTDAFKRYHRETTLAFAEHMGARSAGFQMERFLMRCGYDRVAARFMIHRIWDATSEKHREQLRRQEMFTHVTGWWRV